MTFHTQECISARARLPSQVRVETGVQPAEEEPMQAIWNGAVIADYVAFWHGVEVREELAA